VNLFRNYSVVIFEDSTERSRMVRLKKMMKAGAIVFIFLLLSSCFSISIVERVKNPDRYFKSAYRQIEEIQRHDPRRERRAHHLQMLIYENSDGEMIRMRLPLWLVNGCLDLGMRAAKNERDFDFEEKYDFDWRAIKDLGRLGKGLLVEVEDEENRVLIWLE